MIEKNPNNWNEFKAIITEIRDTYGHHEYSIGNDQTYRGKNIVLFRGQQCADWPLQTTLERKTRKSFNVAQYLLQATKRVHEIESYTGTKWNIPDDLFREIKEKQDDLFGLFLPCYDYLVYLRHHGYPSPLLDWSESPYIAAYFALCDQTIENSEKQNPAIYAYIDKVGPSKGFVGGNPIIKIHGPFVSTHKRHFIQKAWYTVALNWSQIQDQFIFCSHHDIFDNPNRDSSQDILIKITIPIAERKLALKDLDDYNINHFTLFQTEDSLIKALGIKDFDIEDI